jgi:hypothetical protein
VTVVTNSCAFYFAREAAGALGARHSLRPLMFRERDVPAKLARRRGEIAMLCLQMMHCLKIEAEATPAAVIVRESGRSSIPEQLR